MSLNVLNITTSNDESPNHLITKLQQVPAGQTGWKDYQSLGVEIFNYLFFPDLLGQPFKQRFLNADGVLESLSSKRPDAIYPIVSDDFIDGYWRNLFGYICASIAVDFKNLTDAPGFTEVEQVKGYLSVESRQMIGILCCRKGPSKSAIRARYEAWNKERKLILFVSDENIKEMVNLRYDNVNPSNTLLKYIHDFFSRLP